MRNVILLLIRTNFVVIFHPILLADINNKKKRNNLFNFGFRKSMAFLLSIICGI